MPYATMDCLPDSFLARNSAVNILSSGYLRDRFREGFAEDPEAVLRP